MKNRIEKKRRIEASLKENRGGGNSLIQGYPISPSITINVIRETEGEKKKKKKKGVIEARSSAGVSVSIVRGYFRRPWLSSSKEVTRDAQRVTCRDENKLFFQSGSPRDNVAASCALGCSGSCSVGRSISGRVNIDSQPVVPLVVIHERGEDESGERTGGRSKNDIDTRGSNEIPVRVTLDGGGIIESNV